MVMPQKNKGISIRGPQLPPKMSYANLAPSMCRSQHVWPSEYTQAGSPVPLVLTHLCVGNQGTMGVHSQKQGLRWGRVWAEGGVWSEGGVREEPQQKPVV